HFRRRPGPLLFCGGARAPPAAVSWFSAERIFLRQFITSDEASYVFQANNFLDGVIARPPPPFPDAFLHGMIVIHHEAGWFSRYPPGHPLWLIPGLWLGDVRVSAALAAAVAMWFLCAAATTLNISQALIALPLLLSPWFIFMYGTLLSHTSGLAATALLCWAYIRGQQRKSIVLLGSAGLAWSFLFLNRTYTAAWMAVPFGLDALIEWLRHRSRDALARAVVFAGAAAIGPALYLIYNGLATGDPLTPTYLFYDPDEAPGFGPRRMEGEWLIHTPERGWRIFIENAKLLNRWWLGFEGSLALAAILAVFGWSRRWSPTLLCATLAVWLGYIAFWYPGAPEAGGPVYWFETLAPLSLVAGMGFQRLWNGLNLRPALRIAAASLMGVTLAVNSLSFVRREAEARAPAQQARRELESTLAGLPRRSLVLLENFVFPPFHELAFNPKGLESEPIRALSQRAENSVLQRIFRDRPAFLIRGDHPLKVIPLDPPDFLVLSKEAKKFYSQTGTDLALGTSEVARVAREGQDREGWICFGSVFQVPAGRYRLIWTGECRDVPSSDPILFEWFEVGSAESLVRQAVSGNISPVLSEAVIELTNLVSQLSPCVTYGGKGFLALREVRLEEIRPSDADTAAPASSSDG
ncbi:MAG: hypothetical protein NZ740_05980, partial [Kiritimatiellae bacterium]|nr:hypothetical protein [Kiritimatiellia bacterium]MDW8458642.1 hypothetical protein [Verrucomicrobiota bacterium]